MFDCKWIPFENDNYNITEMLIGETNVRFIRAMAQIESNSIPINSMILTADQPLPRELKIKCNKSLVLFVEANGSVYSIICGSKGLEGKIRSVLMETSRRRESRWLTVASKNIPGYNFNKSFYYWLLNKKGDTLELNNNKLELNDVKGFKSDTDRRQSSYSGEGSNIDTEIPLKSLVTMDEKLVSLLIDIRHNNRVNYNFYLDYDGRLGIYIKSHAVKLLPKMQE